MLEQEPPTPATRRLERGATASESVHSLGRGAAESAAKQVKRLLSRLHFLIGNRELERGTFDQIAPATAVRPEAAEARVHRFDALLVFHRLKDVAAGDGACPCRHLRNTTGAAWHRLSRRRD